MRIVPRPSLRTTHKRKVYYKTPGGVTKTKRVAELPNKAVCSICKKELHGVPRILKNIPKTMKRPSRPYGGVLCSKCAREKLRQRVSEKSENSVK